MLSYNLARYNISVTRSIILLENENISVTFYNTTLPNGARLEISIIIIYTNYIKYISLMYFSYLYTCSKKRWCTNLRDKIFQYPAKHKKRRKKWKNK